MIRGFLPIWFLVTVLLPTAASAQFVYKKPNFDLPVPPPVMVEEKAEEPGEPAVPTYEGPHFALSTACSVERQEYAGIRCTSEQPCSFFLELVSVASEGDWIILAGEIHDTEATYESVVLSSSDSGATWTEGAERVAAGGIESVSIVDSEHAFVAGQQGDTATGEKPFLMVTDNGGESWDVRMVEEPGLVVEFRADSPTHGFLTLEQLAATGDPFRLYETFNAGRSWTIRQISAEQPQIPGPRIVLRGENWRLQSDSSAGQFVVSARDSSSRTGWGEKVRVGLEVGACPLTGE